MKSSNNKLSSPYNYKNSTTYIYRGNHTVSKYIKSFDSTLLATDIVYPTDDENNIPSKLPVIVIANRENRRNDKDVEIKLGMDLVKYGYILVSFELRGCGASYGVNDSFGSEEHCKDLIAITEWVSEQDWCTGKIGLLGCSNRAYIQLCTAAKNPKKIDCITPVVATSDIYYQNFPNGVSAIPNFRLGTFERKLSKEEFLNTIDAVDDDIDGIMAYKAFTDFQYENNKDFFETLLIENSNRDSSNPNYENEKVFMTLPPFGKMNDFFSNGKVKQHQFIGQLESGTLGQLAHFIEFGGSVCMGPWTHFGGITLQSDFPNGSLDLVEAYHKLYDSVLKGADNGFEKAPPIVYYMFNAKEGSEWRYSECWPPKNEIRTTLYLDKSISETCDSINDGSLKLDKPLDEASTDYAVRDDINVFKDKNGQSKYNRSELYWSGDMTKDVDNKGLTFTSPPLFPMYQNEMAGCISLDLWISCSANDVDLIVYAEEVMQDGTSRYIKDGVMRASHRTVGKNEAWEKMGATWHTSMTEDVDRCLNEGLSKPTNVKFAVDPIAYNFQPNSRLRITITCANNAVYQHYMYNDNYPTLTLYTGGKYASSISVPFLQQDFNTYKGYIGETKESGTLYVFEKNMYLHSKGTWRKFENKNTFKTKGNIVFLGKENIEFSPIGGPKAITHMPHLEIENDIEHPFPAFRKQFVSNVSIESSDDFLFAPSKKNLFIDIFKDSDAIDQPCIIYIHGYGWPYCEFVPQLHLLHKSGYAIASIDIRNYPPNESPDYIHDAKGAIRFLRANTEKYGIDPKKFATYGVSLGGNTSLMIGLSGDNEDLEGNVGGNLHCSSRVQACTAGYAWSDLLNMGKDIAQEFEKWPDLQSDRVRMTDGAFAPSSALIGFSGKGKGLGVLRDYIESGRTPYNELYEQKIQEAINVSPINIVNPSVPPIALIGGYGMETVNIAFKQSLRTFEALNDVDAMSFLYGNTNGNYGEKDETILAIKAFFDKQLKEERNEHIISITTNSAFVIYDYNTHLLSEKPAIVSGKFMIKKEDIIKYLVDADDLKYETDNGYIDIQSITGSNINYKFYAKFGTIVIKIKIRK